MKLVRQEATYYDNFDLKEFKEYYDNTLIMYEKYDERRNQIFFENGKGFTMEKIFKANVSDYGNKLTKNNVLEYYKDSDGLYYECFYFTDVIMCINIIINQHIGMSVYYNLNTTYHYELIVKIVNPNHYNDFLLKCTKTHQDYQWSLQTCTGKMTLHCSKDYDKIYEILKDKLNITSEIWESKKINKLKFVF